MTDLDYQALAAGVVNWLSYHARLGLQDLFSEYMLAVPIAELACAHGFKVEHEVVHRSFKKTGKGRGEQIDFGYAMARQGKR